MYSSRNRSVWISFDRGECSKWINLNVWRDAPRRSGDEFSWQASINFFKTTRHSRNNVKNGWCDNRHSDVKQWFLNLCKMIHISLLFICFTSWFEFAPIKNDSKLACLFLPALGEGGCDPPLSESGAGLVDNPAPGGHFGRLSGSRCPLEQSRSESLGATVLRWSLIFIGNRRVITWPVKLKFTVVLNT